jgi:hypothetical protein
MSNPYFVIVKEKIESKSSDCRLIGSRIIESAAYYNQKLFLPLFLDRKQNT